jgi:dihydroorotate dehydrogenase electron transfer subunit
MILTKAKILINEKIRIKADFYLLELEAPEIAVAARPGQFVMLSVTVGESPFLKRPMGINVIDAKSGCLRIIYQLKGKGTHAMSKLLPGERLEVLGPLGNGWTIPAGMRSVCLIGGGSGIAPLLPLARQLEAEGVPNIEIILGGKSAEQIICLEDFSDQGKLLIATEDGSLGQRGMVDLYLKPTARYDMVYSCGPTPMMAAVARWAADSALPCQVSLEERMGCGFGVCMGCVCETKSADGHICYQRVCREGSVFAAEEVFFND